MAPKKREKYLPLPSYERVREIFDYNPETGVLVWKSRCSNRIKIGDQAGYLIPTSGVVGVSVDGCKYTIHRIIWLWMTGATPRDEIDHKDCDKQNNRWENLREASRSQNSANKRAQSNNTHGTKGISKATRCASWVAKIKKEGKSYYLGCFRNKADAIAAYEAKAIELYGEFARVA